ncbi:MAG: hypothetical protein US68_C0008G0090 [Candidatus Shapirobacteria bacterium GW2011_GWE1_38_10]|uniref:DUF4446 domain-containing protein n=1 Tax=Candidatus Shapirobacteria bacterium GW2011_GWE1_38_10 TaxID=1618488 RepID=A0A0G0IGU1_9BACT|nr:MAG: hypothetical protein US46_C0006G0055 [Candidatus Shapirobacteria bacterium GW2011_GWF2_37_20]KKQ50205.1 MAG: hypothetical protein US68_C0008G0090 [Candidatus Shapirobacteria bacterium GW2011_GWE1_38_10]KKQ63777.1 MAG: hypothetical protein US85_C0014G0009 [Candidatus Shapirobacteria bacterium GW2011_GWF1_38_23]HBP50749.1 hypothetical protein [Candidatus Shapirobacteria bacterium]
MSSFGKIIQAMPSIFYLLTILNFLGFLYLLFLILTKYRHLPTKNGKVAETSGTIEKMKLVRFNPFDDVGGDQSFILVLLNKENSGLLLTSLHHRSFSRIYAKAIKNGQGDNITLSKEEKSAILKAISR